MNKLANIEQVVIAKCIPAKRLQESRNKVSVGKHTLDFKIRLAGTAIVRPTHFRDQDLDFKRLAIRALGRLTLKDRKKVYRGQDSELDQPVAELVEQELLRFAKQLPRKRVKGNVDCSNLTIHKY